MTLQRITALSALAAAMAFPAMAADDLKPRDLTPVTWLQATAHAPVEIVRDGQARAVVYVADPKGWVKPDPKNKGKNIPNVKRLIDQLVEVVRVSTGATLELVDAAPAAGRPAIVIGDCEETRQAGIEAEQLPVEGFVVKTAPNRVYLVGGTKQGRGNDGTAWAVADFLERFVGVRWYWPAQYGGRSVLHHTSLSVPPAHYRDQPVFPYRTMYQDWYWLQARSFDEKILPMPPGIMPDKQTLWMGDHFKLMRHGISWPHEHVQHGARIYEFISDVPKTNEALFAVRDDGSRNFGTLCYSAPETLELYVDSLQRAWDKKGGRPRVGGITGRSITVWTPLDLGGRSLVSACHCPECCKALAKGGEEHLMGLFIKRLCEQVKQRWPDKTVIYVPWAIPTCPEGVTFSDNLVVCTLNLDAFGLMSQPTIRVLEEERLLAWHKASGRPVHTWIDFAGPSDWTYGPVQFPHLVQDFYLKNRKQLAGTSVLSYGGACFVTAAPTYYVWWRSLWNPELDVDATLDEMCRRLFGPGAAAASELLRLQCERWERTALTRQLQVGEQRIPPRLFREIWPADVVARMKALRDKALADIQRANDSDARQAFLYWTWAMDTFVEYSVAVESVMGETGETAPAAVASQAPASADVEARFHGGPTEINTVRIAYVRRQDGPVAGQSELQFDLSWGNTWRAKWTEPAAANVTGKDLSVESWSAAWVFAKYRLPGREKEGYSHATLSAKADDHAAATRHPAVPASAGCPPSDGSAGTTVDVGLTNGKGMGVFIYRAGPGHGPLDLKNVRLRWLHEADGVNDPGKADLKVFAIEMVYVPRGAFALGSGAGGTESGRFQEGGGSGREFVVDEAWSKPASNSPSTHARRIANVAGRLWGVSQEGHNTIGPEGTLCDAFPTGHDAFYSMRYEVSRGQFADFLNTISSDAFASTTGGDRDHAGGHYTAAGRYALSGLWPNLKPAKPYQACNLLSWWDAAKFAAWAGLRPMTELEYEKAGRGPRKPVANEFAWGTARIAKANYTLANEGKPDERIAENYSVTAGNASYDFTMPDLHGGAARGGVSAVPGSPMRVGIFATSDSERVAAGASYWGILELSGNVREQLVTVGNVKGREFAGTHGSGTWDIPADWPEAKYFAGAEKTVGGDDGLGSGLRGGFFGDMPFNLRLSNRSKAAFTAREASFSSQSRADQNGFRCVRTAPPDKAVPDEGER